MLIPFDVIDSHLVLDSIVYDFPRFLIYFCLRFFKLNIRCFLFMQ